MLIECVFINESVETLNDFSVKLKIFLYLVSSYFLSHIWHCSVDFSSIGRCVFSWVFRIFAALKAFPQVKHTNFLASGPCLDCIWASYVDSLKYVNLHSLHLKVNRNQHSDTIKKVVFANLLVIGFLLFGEMLSFMD